MHQNSGGTTEFPVHGDDEFCEQAAAVELTLEADVIRASTVELSTAANPTAETGSFLDRFLSSFFDERNIKWLLVVGAAIVFGSSLMLATRHWSDWSVTLKYLTILGYTAAGFCAAEIGRRRLGLRVTSRVLYGLTLLLLPVCFLSLSWMSPGTATQPGIGLLQQFILLAPTAALTWLATRRILDFLLSGRQTTYLLSFQLLCLAGIVPAAQHPLAAIGLFTACWLIFTTGVVKVNRYMFRLTEEHQTPRVFGFLPIALSGIQFLTLFVLKCLPALPVEWIGFGSVLVAATVLATARTVADVYRQRTGDLIRPLPWTIVVPTATGLILTFVGIVCAFHGFPHTFAVVPTAALAALLMAWAAKDTQHPAFVWLALLCTTVAYQASPGLFREAALQLRDSAAVVIGEQRLPFAFYGLTYLPLIAVTSAFAQHSRRRGNLIFSRPLQQFSTILAVILFAMAFTHPKAMLLVSAVNVLTFAGMGSVFRDRRYIIGSLIALYAAVWSFVPGINTMTVLQISSEMQLTLLAAVAAVMTFTRLPDRIINTIPIPDGLGHRACLNRDGTSRHLAQLSGCTVAGVLLLNWIYTAGSQLGQILTTAQLSQLAILLSALTVYTFRHPVYRYGLAIWSTTAFAGYCYAVSMAQGPQEILNAGSIVAAISTTAGLLALIMTGQLKNGRSLSQLRLLVMSGYDQRLLTSGISDGIGHRRLLAFVLPLCDLSLGALTVLAFFYCTPGLMLQHFGNSTFIGMPIAALVILGLFFGGIVSRQGLTASIGAGLLPPLCSGIMHRAWFGHHDINMAWVFVIWAAVAGVGYFISARGRGDVSKEIREAYTHWLLIVLGISCFSLSPWLRVAAGIAVASLVLTSGRQLIPWQRSWLAIIVNIQVLLYSAYIGGFRGLPALHTSDSGLLQALPLLLLVTAVSEAVMNRDTTLFSSAVLDFWSLMLRIGMVLIGCLAFGAGDYSFGHAALMLGGTVVGTVSAFRLAVRRQDSDYVWFSLSLPVLSGLWLFRHGFIETGSGISQLILLAAAILCLVGARLCRRHSSLTFAAQPLRLTGQCLPAVVAIMGVGRVVLLTGVLTSGIQTLSMFAAAAMYFHLALITRQRRFAIAALSILNITLMLLWHSLNLTDVQFYLVPIGLSVIALAELLKERLPRPFQNQLRYLGALTILVSPVFEILDGSWLHLMTLMVFCVVVILLAIGLRVRALMYTGSAFLLADLVAMVVRSSIDHPGTLWICGVVFGAAVIALAAFCENHRDRVLQRIRYLSAELATWR